MERAATILFENDHLNLKATELRLGLPGLDEPEQQQSSSSSSSHYVKMNNNNNKRSCLEMDDSACPKAQVVGWPPVRSYRKNAILKQQQKKPESENGSGYFVKVSMDGAPYLRKIDLKYYKNYFDLLKGLEKMFFNNNNGPSSCDQYAATYEDKDGDWMLVGDVPWDMFITSCKRLRIMIKGSELISG